MYGNATINDQIVEQNWKIINKLTFAKNLRARKFKFMLYDFRKQHNKKNWKRLLDAGYSFIPIGQVSKIRNLSSIDVNLPSTEDLINLTQHQNLLLPELI